LIALPVRGSICWLRIKHCNGHWQGAGLQLFSIVNQEIDQWRAAP
jgi:hypothetical protein